MATDPKSIVPLPFAGGGQGYTRQPDGSFAMDVNVVMGGQSSNAPLQYSGATGGVTDTSDVLIFPAAGAGLRNYMTGLQFLNTSATASEIVVKDGSNVIWRGYAPGGMNAPAFAPFPTPLRGSPNTAMYVAMMMTGTATRISAQGYTGA